MVSEKNVKKIKGNKKKKGRKLQNHFINFWKVEGPDRKIGQILRIWWLILKPN